jgi:hypothetical protein
MIYLLATNHCYQNFPDDDFEEDIHKLVDKYKIVNIAEEYSEDAANKYAQEKQSQLSKLSKELNLRHLYCDPGKARRKTLGIPSRDDIVKKLGFDKKIFLNSEEEELVQKGMRKYWGIREQEWLRIIEEATSSNKNTLMVFGAEHKESFSKLLNEKGVKYKNCSL